MLDIKTVTKTGKPNQYLVAPDGYLTSAPADEQAPTFDKTADALKADLLAYLEQEPGVTEIVTDETTGRVSYTAKIAFFKDDVDVEILPALSGSTLAIFSRSRVGYSDLGVNRKRVQKLLSALKD